MCDSGLGKKLLTILLNCRNMNMDYGFDNNIVFILNCLFLFVYLAKKKKNALTPPLPRNVLSVTAKGCISPVCKPFEQ